MRKGLVTVASVITLFGASITPAGSQPSTQPSTTANPPLPSDVQAKIREAQKEIDRSDAAMKKLRDRLNEELKRDRELRGPNSVPNAVVPSTQPDNMPPGSRPQRFNGFTYYIVPLS